jgi:hypothetical protein
MKDKVAAKLGALLEAISEEATSRADEVALLLTVASALAARRDSASAEAAQDANDLAQALEQPEVKAVVDPAKAAVRARRQMESGVFPKP